MRMIGSLVTMLFSTAVLAYVGQGVGTLSPGAVNVAAKSASAQTVASRGFVSGAQPLYGGFALSSAATVYILVRGNSLGTLNITQNYLDAPRVRLFNQANQDLIFDVSGNAGFNACVSTASFTSPAYNYYLARGIAAQTRDACGAVTLAAGVYTFTVNPSTGTSNVFSNPSSGEVLFEVILGP